MTLAASIDGIDIDILTSREWAMISEKAHIICFSESRSKTMDRIDFVMVTKRGTEPLNFTTVKEYDSESVYWQHGGAFPNSKGTTTTYRSFLRNKLWCFAKGYRRITTLVENTNGPMLRVALKAGFIITGLRVYGSATMVELLAEDRL